MYLKAVTLEINNSWVGLEPTESSNAHYCMKAVENYIRLTHGLSLSLSGIAACFAMP